MRRLALAVLLGIGVAGSSAALATTLPRGADETGVTSGAIKVGSVIDQTGRGTIISLHILAGYNLAVTQINAHAGIKGRKIDYRALSDGYDPSQTLGQLKQLVEADGVFAVMGVFGSDDSNVAAPYLESHHVPFFDPIGGGVAIKGKKWIWQTEPDYGREGVVIARFVAQNLHAKRVAVLYQVGIGEPQRDSIKKTLPRYGATDVGSESYSSTDSNLSGQVLRLRALHPDVIVLNGTPTPTTAFIQDARLVGYRPPLGYIANYPMGDPLWVTLVGASTAESDYVSSYADLTGKNVVAAAYRKAIAAYHGEAYSNYGLYGYFNATLFFKALSEVGKHLTRAGFQKVLDSNFRHYNTGFAGTLTWTPAQRFGAREFKIYRIHNGNFVPVTPYLKP
jgi:ABC-type branched-subunit amino acid transport system substrate-binding protein